MKPLLAQDDEPDGPKRLVLTDDGTIDSTADFYERNAHSYSRSTRMHDMRSQLERLLAGLPLGAPVLDLGCGGGRDLKTMRLAGFSPIGLDIAPGLAEIAEAFSGCPIVVGDMRHPPFEEDTFDGIWASASLLHLSRTDLPRTLCRLHGLLRPGGKFFASVKAGVGEECAPDGRWFTYFDPAEWRCLLSSAGFWNIDVEVDEYDKVLPAVARARQPWIQSFASAR